MVVDKFILIILTAVIIVGCSPVPRYDWHKVTSPAVGDADAHGGYSAGCLNGSVKFADEDKGYKLVAKHRGRNFGHPELLFLINKLSKKVNSIYNQRLLISDIAYARGGPAPEGSSMHRSHQNGLDIDIWYARDNGDGKKHIAESILKASKDGLSDFGLDDIHYDIMEELASYAEVERILVNPYLKKEICKRYKSQAWINKVRPWFGHHRHYHVRLHCPKGNKNCKKQAPVANKDSCGKELDWWFSQEAADMLKNKYSRPPQYPKLPRSCVAVFEG